MDYLLKEQRMKVYEVIASCETMEQLMGARKYLRLFLTRYIIDGRSKISKDMTEAFNAKQLKLYRSY